MIVVFVGLGLYSVFNRELGDVVDSYLDDRQVVFSNDLRSGELDLSDEDRLVQVLMLDGQVDQSSSAVPDGTVLWALSASPDLVEVGDSGRRTVSLPGFGSRLRVSASVVETPDGPRILATARRLAAVAQSQGDLQLTLLVGGTVLALAIAVVGRLLIGRVLRPVSVMADRAALLQPGAPAISHLPVPAGDDEFSSLARSLNELLERINVARAHERNFVADVSHELRTPFAILRGELELALLDNEDTSVDSALQNAITEIDRLVALVDRLLTAARSHANGQVWRPTDVAVASEVERILIGIDSGGLEIDRSGIDASPVYIDRDVLSQVLTNLLSNAARHANARVSITTRSADGVFVLTVSDDGPGFDESLGGGQFERFRSGESDQFQPGRFGIGLSIVQQLCDQVDGSLSVQTSADGGSEVDVRLPTRRVRR